MLDIHITRNDLGHLQATIDSNPPLILAASEIHIAMQDLREQYPNHEITISEELVDEL